MRLRALSDSPDAFGSTFASEAERSDDEWASRLSRGTSSPRDLPLVAEVDGEPSGLAWARIEEDEPTITHLYQVWVAPERRQLGIGKALLEAAIAWARSARAQCVALNVTCVDSPAMRLYLRAGFVPIGKPQPLPSGVSLAIAIDAAFRGFLFR